MESNCNSDTSTLHWLPVEKKRDFKVLRFVYRDLHDQAPEYMRDLVQKRTNVRTLCSSLKPSVPWSRLKDFGDHAFSIALPKLFNALPGSLTDCKSIMS